MIEVGAPAVTSPGWWEKLKKSAPVVKYYVWSRIGFRAHYYPLQLWAAQEEIRQDKVDWLRVVANPSVITIALAQMLFAPFAAYLGDALADRYWAPARPWKRVLAAVGLILAVDVLFLLSLKFIHFTAWPISVGSLIIALWLGRLLRQRAGA